MSHITPNGGQLRWAIKDSFIDYVRRGGGTIELRDGALEFDGAFVFPRRADDARMEEGRPRGTAAFGGSVQFQAHGGMLDVVIGAPRVIFGATRSRLVITDVDGDAIELATLELGEAVERENVIEWERVMPKLTSDGADTFFGVYPAYMELDPIRLRLDSSPDVAPQ